LLATIGLTIPAVAANRLASWTSRSNSVSAPGMLTSQTGRTNILFGMIHIVVFAVCVFMVFVP
jgi:Ca2+:H+ antiporter